MEEVVTQAAPQNKYILDKNPTTVVVKNQTKNFGKKHKSLKVTQVKATSKTKVNSQETLPVNFESNGSKK